MERPIGSKFKVDGCVYVVVKDVEGSVGCSECAIYCHCVYCDYVRVSAGRCSGGYRTDRMNVHFEHFGVDF